MNSFKSFIRIFGQQLPVDADLSELLNPKIAKVQTCAGSVFHESPNARAVRFTVHVPIDKHFRVSIGDSWSQLTHQTPMLVQCHELRGTMHPVEVTMQIDSYMLTAKFNAAITEVGFDLSDLYSWDAEIRRTMFYSPDSLRIDAVSVGDISVESGRK